MHEGQIMTDDGNQLLAQRIRAALEDADLTAFADLLDPRVTWGAPGDSSPACRNREQVLDWYRRGRADGRRGRVLDIASHDDKILVTMKVTTPQAPGAEPEADRWQVLTVGSGRICDIRGYDNEGDARAAAGLA